MLAEYRRSDSALRETATGIVIADQMKSILGEAAVITEMATLQPYTQDYRGRYNGTAACVVLPSSVDQVAAIVKACVAARVPVVPQGGNTSLCEGAVPRNDRAWVVINMARMRRIRSVDAANNSMTVDAGCILADVQQAAAGQGRLYPVSLGAEGSCQIGGTIATNAGGTSVLRYGNTRENVLGIEVVLPSGEIWNGLRGLRKDNTGPDLKHLFIGSEGTLGVITGAILKLHPLPAFHATAWVAVASPQAALELLALCQARASGALCAYELLNKLQLDIVLQYGPDCRAPLSTEHPWHVLIELSGPEKLDDALQEILEKGLAAGLVADAVLAANGAQRAAWWEIRHSVTDGNKKAGVGIATDTAVPVSAVPRFIERATVAAHRVLPGAHIIIVGHLGDGNVHFITQVSFEQWARLPDPQGTALKIKHAVNEVAHELGGTFSAEHGIGQTLTADMAVFKPPAEIAMLRAIKKTLDPHNIFNPGRLLPDA